MLPSPLTAFPDPVAESMQLGNSALTVEEESKRNYDIGNRELLAMKLALEEWHHWLEGAKLPFLVWTDHTNL